MGARAVAPAARKQPVVQVRKISTQDLNDCLREGYQDFLSKRGDLIFVGFLYPLIGLVTASVALNGVALPLLFPMIFGLALLGPLVSAGFYELARRRENGEASDWSHFFDVRRGSNFDALLFVGVVLIAIFAVWILAALAIYHAFFGTLAPDSTAAFFTDIFTTAKGWGMIVVGNLAGLFFAVLVLAVSFVSLPLLVDRDVRAGRAIRTSYRAYRANRIVCLQWGARVLGLLVLGSIPFFLGLAVVLPVLGYATWHLYTRIVDRSSLPPTIRRS